MFPSRKRCSALLAAFCLLPSAFLVAGERIPFSMIDAQPIVSQSSKPRIEMSIHDQVERTISTAAAIPFSVHDAKELGGDAPKPDCSPARTVNRMLVIHPATQTIKIKVCDQFGCRFELRSVPHPILSELKKLAPKWSCGDKDCDHFRLVNADDPKQADLLRELDVKPHELPLLVKETDVEKRKKAAGMSGEDIAKLWNKWFVEPKAEAEKNEKAEVEKCLPQFGSDSHQWTYPGSIRSHLTDPRQVHHLPKAVVDAWTDTQCVAWHNWHHEVLSGQRSPVTRPAAVKSRGQSQSATRSPLENRIASIALATIRTPPPQMVAAANASYGNSSEAKRAKKKPSTLSRNGSLTSVAA